MATLLAKRGTSLNRATLAPPVTLAPTSGWHATLSAMNAVPCTTPRSTQLEPYCIMIGEPDEPPRAEQVVSR